MTTTSPDIRALLTPTPFGRVEPAVLDAAVQSAHIERFDVPTLLNRAGEPLRALRLVVDGHVQIIARKASGKELVLADMATGTWATWLGCLMPKPPEHDFYSTADTVCIALPVPQVQGWFQQYPALYPLVIAEIGVRMRHLMEWAGQSVLLGPEQRMAKLIHILAREQRIAPNGRGTLLATQQRLAGMARCSRQTANGLLAALEAKGLIAIAYGKCEIPDMLALAAYAEDEYNPD